jgi:hypothetical protein
VTPAPSSPVGGHRITVSHVTLRLAGKTPTSPRPGSKSRTHAASENVSQRQNIALLSEQTEGEPPELAVKSPPAKKNLAAIERSGA